MIWSISSGGFDTMSVGPQGANERHRPWWCEGPYGWWPPLSAACVLSHTSNSHLPTLKPGGHNAAACRTVIRAGYSSAAFAVKPDEYLAALEERLIKLS